MSSDRLDVPAYLARIGYAGPVTPSLDTLAAIQRHHISAIPFETLAMILGEPVRLDLPSLRHKLLDRGRGGYCFELNLLFLHLLRAIGFDAQGLTGRVVMNTPPGVVPARTHVLTLVSIDGTRYVTDVGFGGMTPTAPLRLDMEAEQDTPNEPYRLVRHGETYALTARVDDTSRTLYVFDLASPADIDFEVGNWYVSTHPSSPFRNRLLVARSEPGVRHTLRGSEYAIHRIARASERRQIDNPDAVIELLQTVFRIRLPEHPNLRDALGKVLSASPA
ncbi:N-hydroxyarylamine O-acetyltransferase [Hyphomicrobium nitrativorans NL23]|uniref:N-hydroxyarylamine O-acetyltransferase n=1 Tax=Hyphomicrobium nitrativorans NL23 TaxID=1029756 RepID=V5SDK6_9HYPH|nr:arylamine N-acetyltransferase [Hyphomicrobium nitrativorans]AHB48034.1 N-hydroxyarylamine O-acetyltransferase [Hyphomicrobium nitrativorans NL23]